MRKFRKIWDESTNGFLIARKGMRVEDIHAAFMSAFPQSGVSLVALRNQMSRLHLLPSRPHGSTRARPLYSEQIKKGYVRIKIAQPNVWVSKAMWVYMETHPWEDFTERSNYVFLNGNARDFSPENIAHVPLSIMGPISEMGGLVPGEPDLNRIRIARAMLAKKTLDLAVRAGLTTGKQRVLKSTARENARRRALIPGYKAERAVRARERLRLMRENEQDRYAEILRKDNERRKRYGKYGKQR